MTRVLAELGWSSWVLTAAGGSVADVPGVTIVRCPPRKTLNDRYGSWRGGSPSSESSSPSRSESNSVPLAHDAVAASDSGPPRSRGLAGALREAVTSAGVLLVVPDEARGWIMRAAGVARRLIREVNPSVVISSGPPHSAHLVGRLACWPRGPAWFMDLRDPILSHAFAPFEAAKVFSRYVIEKVTLRSATGVLCVTQESAAEVANRFPGIRVAHLPNGIDVDRLPPATPGDTLFPGLAVAHVGTLYAKRDPSVALRAMRLLLDRHPDLRSQLKLRLIGNFGDGQGSKVAEVSRALDVTPNVEVHGQMPRAEALRVVRRSHITLIFAQEQVVQVPAKLYEAAAIARDVIVVAEHDSASGKEALRLGASLVAPDDAEGLARMFERAWRGERLGAQAAERVREIDYRAIAERLPGILEAGGALPLTASAARAADSR